MPYDLHTQKWLKVWQFPGLLTLYQMYRRRYDRDPDYVILPLKAFCEAFHCKPAAGMAQEMTWDNITVAWDVNAATMCYVGPIPKGGNE